MVQIRPYQRKAEVKEAKESEMGKFLQVGGAVVGGIAGGIAGGPMGAMGGASTGASLGSTIGGVVDPARPGEVIQKETITTDQPDNAMNRRLAQSKEDRLVTLRNAEAALGQLPKELQQQYASPIVSATMAEEKRRAMAMG